MSVKNITDLRDDALKTLEKLQKGKIDIEEAGVTSKLYENIMSTIKTQLEAAKMLGLQPNIPFLSNMDRWAAIEGRPAVKTIEHEKKKLK